MLKSLDLRWSLEAAHSLSLFVDDLRSTWVESVRNWSLDFAASFCKDMAEICDASLAHVEIEGSLLLLSKPRLRPSDRFVLWVALV